jgi:hypothetical protein
MFRKIFGFILKRGEAEAVISSVAFNDHSLRIQLLADLFQKENDGQAGKIQEKDDRQTAPRRPASAVPSFKSH